MKVAGIIAEYNPFHNGHLYQIEQLKKQIRPDYIVVIMSGYFVQRGAPALLSPYERAQMALSCGVDLVIQLPCIASIASAEFFALQGITLLERLGCITHLCFGCEAEPGDFSLLDQIASLYVKEPPHYQTFLKGFLNQGDSYPTARHKATIRCFPEEDSAVLQHILGHPNNILAVEYLKALKRLHSSIEPVSITRTNDYHSTHFHKSSASASAVRSNIFKQEDTWKSYVPFETKQHLETALKNNLLLREDDFSFLLHEKLLSYQNTDTDLSRRLINKKEQFLTWTQFVHLVKTKNQTYTGISRLLTKILLNAPDQQTAFYALVLGFRKSASNLLALIKQTSSIPLICKLSRADKLLSCEQMQLFSFDLYAAEIYRIAATEKGKQVLPNIYRQSLILLP